MPDVPSIILSRDFSRRRCCILPSIACVSRLCSPYPPTLSLFLCSLSLDRDSIVAPRAISSAFQRRISRLSSKDVQCPVSTNVSETRHRGTRFRERREPRPAGFSRCYVKLGQTDDQDRSPTYRSTFSTSTCREIPKGFVAASQLRVKDQRVLVESSLKSYDTCFTR